MNRTLREGIKMVLILKNGLLNGLKTVWILSRILVPVYFLVTFLSMTPIIGYITILFEPIMFLFGLPGEAAIVLVLGNVINLYAAIGALASLDLTAQEMTTIALMLSFSHSLLVETAIFKHMRVNIKTVLMMRIALAVMSGILLNLLWRFVL